MDWKCGVGVVEGFWKTRDNGGKAAWLFIGVLSSVYWVSDVITDDELAVLIMRACSSRNLFVKHHIILDVSTQWVFSAMPDLPLTTYWSGPHNSQQSSPLASLSSILCTTGYGTPFWTRLSQKMRELCKLIPPMTMHYEELLPHIFSGFLSFLIGNILHPRIMSHPT